MVNDFKKSHGSTGIIEKIMAVIEKRAGEV